MATSWTPISKPSTTTWTPVGDPQTDDELLLETGDKLLLEDGDNILLESDAAGSDTPWTPISKP